MKIKGDFILREVVGEYVLIPVHETALHFDFIISLNAVGAKIWKGLQMQKSGAQILSDILDEFDVTVQEAMIDMAEFLDDLKQNNLIE